jgi:hypothetical protein
MCQLILRCVIFMKTRVVQQNTMIFVIFIMSIVLFFNAGNYITGFAGGAGWNSTESQVTGQNLAPTIGTVDLNGGTITLTAGTTKTVTCEADITDLNGRDDILTGGMNITIYEDTAESVACTADSYDCYKNLTFNAANAGDVCVNESGSTTLTCTLSVQMYWNARNITTWKCNFQVNDSALSVAEDSATRQVDDLLAIDIGGTALNFGTLDPGAFSDNKTMSVYNYGNTVFNLSLNGSEMDCASGENISVGNITYNLTGGIPEGIEWVDNLTDTSTPTAYRIWPNLTAEGVVPTASTNDTWWKLYLPVSSEGARGLCTGTIWYVAEQS